MIRTEIKDNTVISSIEFDFDVVDGMKKDPKILRIRNLWTAIPYLRQGYASKLIKELIAELEPTEIRVFARACGTSPMQLSQKELELFYSKFSSETLKVTIEN